MTPSLNPRPPSLAPKQGLARSFFRGLVTLLPVLLTIVIFGLVFQMVDRYVTGPINTAIYWFLEGNGLGWKALDSFHVVPFDKKYLDPNLLPVDLQDIGRANAQGYSDPEFLNALNRFRHDHLSFFRDLTELGIHRERLRSDVQRIVPPFVGVIVSLLLVLWLGWLVGGFFGRRLVRRLDDALHVIPVVKSVYPYSKQLVEFFFAENKVEFDRVVGVPYPSAGLWSVGFVTSNGLRSLRRATGKRLVTVFVPSSPMPMTGYTVCIEEERLIPLPMSVDEALRIIMTGGVLLPSSEQVAVEEDHEPPALEEAGQ